MKQVVSKSVASLALWMLLWSWRPRGVSSWTTSSTRAPPSNRQTLYPFQSAERRRRQALCCHPLHSFWLRTTRTCDTTTTTCLRATEERGFEKRQDDDDDDDDSDDEEGVLAAAADDDDWREFRARLVLSENREKNKEKHEPTSSDDEDAADDLSPLWAYDSGQVIEQGSIILSSLEQDFGYGLAQQYFHKSVILVLEHSPGDMTMGVVLNRPTNLLLANDDFVYDDGTPLSEEEEDHKSQVSSSTSSSKEKDKTKTNNKWRVWYGGELDPITSDSPELICLHSLQSRVARQVSRSVLKQHHHDVLQYCSFETAHELVQTTNATSDDFWLFGGYVGWGPGQLLDELQRNSWHMVATDPGTIWEELSAIISQQPQQQQQVDDTTTFASSPDKKEHVLKTAGGGSDIVGVSTWERLMQRIGLGDQVHKVVPVPRESSLSLLSRQEEEFEDLMLREWVKENLMLADQQEWVSGGDEDNDQSMEHDTTTTSMMVDTDIPAGTLLRGSSMERSPFLLSDQGFHHSVLLVIDNDPDVIVGVLLNRPLPDSIQFETAGRDHEAAAAASSSSQDIPVRYGGRLGCKGQSEKPTFWFHCRNPTLQAAKLGTPLGGGGGGGSSSGIWMCERDDVRDALRCGLAKERDFICTKGVVAWPKKYAAAAAAHGHVVASANNKVSNDLPTLIASGHFEVVPPSKTGAVWDALVSQKALSTMTLDTNLMLGDAAWSRAAGGGSVQDDDHHSQKHPKCSGGAHEQDGKIAELCQDALKCWMAAYLLGEPLLRQSDSAFG